MTHDNHDEIIDEVLSPPPVPAPASEPRRTPTIVWVLIITALVCAIFTLTVAWLQSRSQVSESISSRNELQKTVDEVVKNNKDLELQLGCVTRQDASLDIQKSEAIAALSNTQAILGSNQAVVLGGLYYGLVLRDPEQLAAVMNNAPQIIVDTEKITAETQKLAAQLVAASEEREETVKRC